VKILRLALKLTACSVTWNEMQRVADGEPKLLNCLL